MRQVKYFLIMILLISGITAVYAQPGGVRKKRPPRHEFGNVLINNYSEAKKIAPVVFKHWLHRSKFTCRLCHIDIGFAMEAGGTGMTEEDNLNGLYCGSCHNGKEAFGPKEKGVIGSITKKNCDFCHSYDKKVEFKNDFYKYTKKFPRARFGDKINWQKVEEAGMIKLKDYLEGVSFETKPIKYSSAIEMKSTVTEMPDIIFSHEKHTIWNGCELCHPDIFGIKKGSTKYTMQDIFAGRFCGACHGKVAFPNQDCQRCHTENVY
jgi:c(7)-type cytochrome triheme protein